MTTEPHMFFDPKVYAAMERLRDPTKSVRCRMLKGFASPKMELQHSVFPPKDIHPDHVPAIYRFEMEGWVHFEIKLMTFWYCPNAGSSEYTVIGLISHSQREELSSQSTYAVGIEDQFVAVHYNPFTREGWVYVSKEFYELLQILKSAELYGYRDSGRDTYTATRQITRAA